MIWELFGSVGEGISIDYNFYCDLGYNIYVGCNFYVGYNCIILDMVEVCIGDDCMIVFNVGIYMVGYNVNLKDRNKLGYGIFIIIGNNVWIGGYCVVFLGVLIGDNFIIVVGLIVIKDVLVNMVVVGNLVKVFK